MRILTYITTEEDAGRAARSVVPRRFQLGTHAFRRLKVEGGILWCVTELVSKTQLDKAVSIVKEVLK